MSLYASWIHGNSAILQRRNPNAIGKNTILSSFGGETGDVVDLGHDAAVACLRSASAARFEVFDSGSKRFLKSGEFWCHYAVPTPVIESGRRARARAALLSYICRDVHRMRIDRIQVWDGMHRIADDSHEASNFDFDGGIPKIGQGSPDFNRLARVELGNEPVFFGLGVSLHVVAQEAREHWLEIRGVGIDFAIED